MFSSDRKYGDFAAGTRTKWIIEFAPTGDSSDKFNAHFLIPYPESYIERTKGQWLDTGALKKEKAKADEKLQQIQSLCDHIEKNCAESAEMTESFNKQSADINKHIDDLDQIIKRFQDILNKFKNEDGAPPAE